VKVPTLHPATATSSDPPQHARALLTAAEGETLHALLTTFLVSHAVLWLQHTRVFDITHLRTLRVLQQAKLTLLPALPALLPPQQRLPHEQRPGQEQQQREQRGIEATEGSRSTNTPGRAVPTMCFVCTAPRGNGVDYGGGGGGGGGNAAAAAAAAKVSDGNLRTLLRNSNAYVSETGGKAKLGSLFLPPAGGGPVCVAVPPPHALLPAFAFAFGDLSVTGGGGGWMGAGGGVGVGVGGDEDGGGGGGGSGGGDPLAEIKNVVKEVERTFWTVGPAGGTVGGPAGGNMASTLPSADVWEAAAAALASALNGGGGGGVSGGGTEGGSTVEDATGAVAKARQWLGACTDPEAQLAEQLNDAAKATALGVYTHKQPAEEGQPYSPEAHAVGRAAALGAFWSAARGPAAGAAAAAVCAACDAAWAERRAA
jgi:hypothetical protein